MKKSMQQGFTLIELMIVVAIIAILTMFAIPAYQDYTIRSQVSEGAALADGSKTALAEYYSNTGNYPTTQGAAGLASAKSIVGKYVYSVDATGNPGKIYAQYGYSANNKINGKILVFSAVTHTGSLSWSCTNVTGTTVDTKYLPTSCRS